MISGKDKPFIPGKPFKYPKWDNEPKPHKGRVCIGCDTYKSNMYYDGPRFSVCKKCKNKEAV